MFGAFIRIYANFHNNSDDRFHHPYFDNVFGHDNFDINSIFDSEYSSGYDTGTNYEYTTGNSSGESVGELSQDVIEKIEQKMGEGFCEKLQQIADNLKCDPNDLLGLMYSESGLNSGIVNASSGATGLIQFMPATAQSLGTTTQELANMSPIEQLDYVEKYFQMTKASSVGSDAQLDAGTLYALCFLPACASSEVLCSSSGSLAWAYNANSALDTNNDGQITKTEMGARISNKFAEAFMA